MIEARIRKRFPPGPESAGFLLDVEFQAEPGVSVLFGPSGSGKTLTLSSIAGFVKPDAGRIQLDGQILYDADSRVCLRPQSRSCGYVFQNYALFPHMSLRENLTFAAVRHARLERYRAVSEMLDRFELGPVSGRRPHEVSGGEQQRCSIARALIGNPRLLLLDEPARGLDLPLRAGLYRVLRQVRAEYQIPILLVTHDLDECFELGDRMLVLREGCLVQTGTPSAIRERPASIEVARLLGLTNLFRVEIVALDPGRDQSRLRFEGFELSAAYLPGHLIGDRVWVSIPAEELRVSSGTRPGPNQASACLVRACQRSQSVRLEFEGELSVDVPRAEFEKQKHNKEWLIEFPAAALRVIEGGVTNENTR